MVPLVAAFMVLLVLTTASNGDSYADMLTEAVHAVQVGGAALVWALSRAVPRPAGGAGRVALLKA